MVARAEVSAPLVPLSPLPPERRCSARLLDSIFNQAGPLIEIKEPSQTITGRLNLLLCGTAPGPGLLAI